MFICLIVFWIILNGRISTELCVIGLIMSLVLFFLSFRHLGYSLERDIRVLKKLPVFVIYIGQLIMEMIQSTIKVMGFVFSAKYDPEPIVTKFYIHFHTNIGMALMANYITLTPGTITVEVQKNHFTVHCLDPDFAPDPNGRMVEIIKKLEER